MVLLSKDGRDLPRTSFESHCFLIPYLKNILTGVFESHGLVTLLCIVLQVSVPSCKRQPHKMACSGFSFSLWSNQSLRRELGSWVVIRVQSAPVPRLVSLLPHPSPTSQRRSPEGALLRCHKVTNGMDTRKEAEVGPPRGDMKKGLTFHSS